LHALALATPVGTVPAATVETEAKWTPPSHPFGLHVLGLVGPSAVFCKDSVWEGATDTAPSPLSAHTKQDRWGRLLCEIK
jgi:hypothetical protein